IKAALKGKELYHVCFLVGKTQLLRAIDWRPAGKISRSYQAHEDVGHRLGSAINSKDVEHVNFIDCKGKEAKIFTKLQSDEFHDASGKVLAGHFGRGSNIGGKAIRKNFLSHDQQLKRFKKI